MAIRQVGRFNLKIWQIMLGGALAVLLTGQIAPIDALRAINTDLMIFLFGMFVVGEALVQSGYLASITHRFFSGTKNTGQIVLVILFGMGILSAILMNDTLAIIGTPVVLALATRCRISPRLLLLTLAFAITTGSVMSPIGNPQNLLVAINSGMPAPFVTFALYLVVPTLISLGVTFLVLRVFCRKDFAAIAPAGDPPAPCNNRLTFLCKGSLAILLSLTAANIVTSLAGLPVPIPLPLIGLLAALPILLFSDRRIPVLRTIDWCTLVFFATMFVLMASVWQSGFFQSFMDSGSMTSVPVILGLSVVISQFISNVPFVALFQPMILAAGETTARLMALAAGSTIAGNLTILGAASNVIIIQNAEKEGETLGFYEFARVGVPLTIIQICIFAGWLAVVG
nr:SLC13 family permease [uncultured Methanoregula sp.]